MDNEMKLQPAQEIAQKGKQLVWANRRLIIVVLCLVVFLLLLEDVWAGDIMRLDVFAYRHVVQQLRGELLTPVMEAITNLATPAVLVVVWLVASAFAPGRQPGRCMLLNLVGAALLNFLLKNLVQRPRPEGFRLVAAGGYSFPSGHSMVAMAFYGLLAYLVWRYEKDSIMRWLWSLSLGFIVAAVGISRIYLGVHYASDVLAGFCVAMAWLAIYTKVVCPLFLPEPAEAQ